MLRAAQQTLSSATRRAVARAVGITREEKRQGTALDHVGELRGCGRCGGDLDLFGDLMAVQRSVTLADVATFVSGDRLRPALGLRAHRANFPTQTGQVMRFTWRGREHRVDIAIAVGVALMVALAAAIVISRVCSSAPVGGCAGRIIARNDAQRGGGDTGAAPGPDAARPDARGEAGAPRLAHDPRRPAVRRRC